MNEIFQLQESELDKELIYEVSKDIKITTKLTFRKGDIIEQLMNKIQMLENDINKLKGYKSIAVEDSLKELWENGYDDKWDKC